MSVRNHYLLFCTTGLGDSIFCTPAIRFLRKQDPGCCITVVAKEKLANLFQTNPHINEILTYRNNFFSMWRARRRILSKDYRAIFLFHVGGEVVRLFQGAQYAELHCVQKLKDLPAEAKLFPIDIKNKRQWEDFADMVALVCGGRNSDDEFEVPLDSKSIHQAKRFYHGRPVGLKVGIQLGGSHLGKCWPPERFSRLANHLVEERNAMLFINATAAEEALWSRFRKSLSEKAHARAERLPNTSIIGLAALLKELDLFVTNDTGPLHVALAQQVPVVALKAHDENTFAYTLPRATPLRRPVFIQTNVQTSGKEYQSSHRAMECIPVDLVISEVDAVLSQLSKG